jgi:hypothetical protein
MGIFDKIGTAIEQIQDLAKEVGASTSDAGAESAVDAASGSASDTGSPPPGPGGGRVGRDEAFDATTWPPDALVAGATRREVASSGPERNDEWTGRSFRFGDGGHASFLFATAPEGDSFSSGDWWDYLTTEVADTEPLEIGDSAFRSGDTVFARLDGSVVQVTVGNANGTYDRDAAAALTKAAAGALPEA